MHRGYKMAQKHDISIIEKPMTVATTEQGPQKRYRRLRFPSFNADVWAEKNPLLQKGELGHEKDTGRFKVGDGVTYWLDLPYNSVGDPAKVNGHNVLEIIAGKNVEIEQSGNVLIIGASGAGYTKQEIDDKFTVANAQIDANAVAIAKTRDDYMSADTDIMTIINNHAEELITLHNDIDELGDDVAGIQAKIPESTSETNPLINKQQLLDEEMDIRDDLNEGLSELQTQITAQATAIATKQDQLIAGDNITIVDNIISATGGGGSGGISSVAHDDTLSGAGTDASPLGVAKNLSVEELTVGTDEGTLNLSITAGVATIATNNGLDIVSQTKFDKAPTTDDNTTWADALDTSLVRKAQVASAMAGFEALPDQSGNSGKFLTTNGTTASWSDKAIVNNAVNKYGVAIGSNSQATQGSAVSVGSDSSAGNTKTLALGDRSIASGGYSSAIGAGANATARKAIQLGAGTNSDANTLKVANDNGNFEIMSADGTIPADRMSATAGTTGQVLTKTDAGMEWQEASGGTTITLKEYDE